VILPGQKVKSKNSSLEYLHDNSIEYFLLSFRIYFLHFTQSHFIITFWPPYHNIRLYYILYIGSFMVIYKVIEYWFFYWFIYKIIKYWFFYWFIYIIIDYWFFYWFIFKTIEYLFVYCCIFINFN
jgi:hypothetical protein